MGDLTYGKNPKKGYPKQDLVWVKGFFPAIFTEEWQTLLERLGLRRESSTGRAHSSEYMLSGIVGCGYCDGPLIGPPTRTRSIGTTGVPGRPGPGPCVAITTNIQ